MKTPPTESLPAKAGASHAAESATKLATPMKAIMRAARHKLNECRSKCPGIGGDIDASNLSWLIEHDEWQQSTTDQAANTLESLSSSLDIDASSEVAALRLLPSVNNHEALVAALSALIEADDRNDLSATLKRKVASQGGECDDQDSSLIAAFDNARDLLSRVRQP